MRITVLLENTKIREDLACEHGLSLYIETGDKRILFDAGQTGAFADNAEKLGIDLKSVDFAVLSHGHYDHSGGLIRFLSLNPTTPIYLSRHAFGPHYNASGKFIGVDPALAESPRLVFVDDYRELAPGLALHSTLVPRFPTDTCGLTHLEEDILLPEDFRHEQYLLIEEAGNRICISGCSHRGILNIASQFQPDVLIGGFHFMKLDPDSPALTHAAETLMEYPTVYYTGHCTGESQYTRLKAYMGRQLHRLSTGITFEI